MALVYVYQQTEIFYLAYLGGKKQTILADLLDKNNIFRYNINRLSSLPYLDNKILQNVDFEMPIANQLVRVAGISDNTQISPELERRPNLIVSFFGKAKPAQAEPLNR